MPKKCPACAKADNPDTATLCHRCGTRLPRSAVGAAGAIGAGAVGAAPRQHFGPMVCCDPKIPAAQIRRIQGTVENILSEPAIGRGGTNQRWYGVIRLAIKLLTLAGVLLVLVAGVGSLVSGGVFHAVVILLGGGIASVIFFKLTNWLLESLFFSFLTISTAKRPGTTVLTRVLAVRPTSGMALDSCEAHLKSTRFADVSMPKIGDFIEIDGAVQNHRVLVRSYRLVIR